jgi:hypothetical protein
MAVNDLQIVKGVGETRTMQTQDRTTSSQTTQYLPGEPLKMGTIPYVIALADGDPEVGTDEFVGICRKQSTETSSADGVVEYKSLLPGATQIRGKATTGTNINTVAKINALIGNWVSMDVTGAGTNGSTGVFTFDENETSDPNKHGFKILGGDSVRQTLDCLFHANASEAAPLTGQTMD